MNTYMLRRKEEKGKGDNTKGSLAQPYLVNRLCWTILDIADVRELGKENTINTWNYSPQV
jgi:hypothetical protein